MEALDTATPGAPPPGDPSPRRLTRSRTDRKIGGVCGGLAAYTGIDPVVFRVLAAASAIVGGTGFLAYVIAWVVLPEDDEGQPSNRSDDPPRTDVLLLIVAGLALLSLLSQQWPGRGVHLDLAPLFLAGIAYWWWSRHRGTDEPLVDKEVTEAVERATARVRRRWSRTTGVTLSAVILTAGIFAAVSAAGTEVDPTLALGTILLVLAAGTVAGAWLGGGRALLPLCALLAVATVISGVVDVPITHGAGDRTWAPATEAVLAPSYRLGAGDAELDLRGLTALASDHHVDVSLGLGDLRIELPTDVPARVKVHAGVGNISVFGAGDDGVDVTVDRALGGAAAGTLDLDVHVGAGDVTVTR